MNITGNKILCIGDSITYDTVSPTEGAYRVYLAPLLTSYFRIPSIDWCGDNTAIGMAVGGNKMCGASGQRVDEVITSYEPGTQVARWLPDLVIIHLGTNDMTQMTSGTWPEGTIPISIANYANLLNLIFAANPTCLVAACKIIPNTGAADANITIWNTALEEMVGDQPFASRIFIPDCNAAFKANGNWAVDYMFDATHPNTAGKVVIANTINTAIQANITRPVRFPIARRRTIRPHTAALTYKASTGTILGASNTLNTALSWAVAMDINFAFGKSLTTTQGLLCLKTDQATPFIFLSLKGSTNRAFEFGSNASFGRFFVNVGSEINFFNRFCDGWHQIIVTFDGVSRTAVTSYKMYLDGIPCNLTSGAGLGASTNQNGIGVAVSAGAAGTFQMANLSIWNGGSTMTPDQVRAFYYDNIFPSGPTLIRNYAHTDGSGTVLTDTTGTQNGAIGTAAWIAVQPTSIRRVINASYNKSWGFNGSTSTASSASAIDFSGGLKYVFDFWYLMRATGGATEILTNNVTAVASPSGTFKILRGNVAKTLALQWNDAGGSQVWTSEELPLNQWAHIALVIDSTSGIKLCKIFVNGISSGVLSTNTATGGSFLTNDILRLDKSSGGTGAGLFNGLMKDLKMSSFTGIWADTHALSFYQGIIPTGYTALHRWIGDDDGASAADSVGAIALTLTANTYTASTPSLARRIINPSYTKSWLLNGKSSYSKTNSTIDLSTYNKLVIDFWINETIAGGGQTLVELSSNYGSGTDRFWIGTIGSGNGRISARMVTSGGEANWSQSVQQPARQWTHVIGVFDRTLVSSGLASRIYTNGALDGAITIATGTLSGNFRNDTLNVGSTNGTTSFFGGKIKDLRISSFSGSFISADALKFYQGIIPDGYTLRNRWIGEESGITATDSVGSNLLDLTSISYDSDTPSKARTVAT